MARLRDCIGKVYGKLITKADADRLMLDSYALQEGGLTPIEAERQAVENALEQAKQGGQDILDQIRAQRPVTYGQAEAFWNRETIRPRTTPPPLPAFVTEAGRAAPQAPPPLPAFVPPEVPVAPVEAVAVPQPPPIPEPAPPPIPEQPAAPISDAAQEMVNSLPEEQRGAAQKAFQRDNRDPYANRQRADGKPVTKRMGKPVAPEKNTKLVGELSKYDLGKTMSQTVTNIASDPKQPRWIRVLSDLFVQLGLGQGVDIRVVNTPDAIWPALYVINGETGRPEVLINLSHKGPDLARRLLHELMHHGTLSKLTGRESDLMPAELAAKRELEKIFDDIRSRPEFEKLYGTTSLHEFVSEIFSNDELRAKLDAIKPDGKVSILQRILDSIKAMFIGDRDKIGMRPGTMLDVALREALKVVGSRAVETSPQSTAAMMVAPMAVEEHRMKIDREKRKLAEKTQYTKEEREMLHGKISKLLDKNGLTGPGRARIEGEYQKQAEDQVRAARAKFSPEGPDSDRWMEIEPKDIELQIEKGRKAQKAKKGKKGQPDTPAIPATPDTEKAVVTWVDEAYTFEKGTDATEMARKVVDSVKEIVAKSKDPNAEGHANAVIQMRQRGWYRNMTLRLRQEFGGFADLFADLLGALSPNTGVDQNWKFAIIALRNVSSGVYDKELQVFDEWLKAGKSINDYKTSGQPMILQPNGKLFGMNSDKAMKAMLDYWRLIKAGDSPKARNFALNLIGQSNKATIDVWAARFLQRMAGHPRVPILAEKAVAGKHLTDVTKVGGAFGFGQEVFKQATEILRNEMPEEFGELNPPDLQALVWFAEKELWSMKDWTSTIGEGGSFEAMADIEMVQRFVVGLSHERPHSVPTTAEQIAASKSLNGKLAAMGKVIASRVKDSYGMFMGTPERSFDIEVLTGPGFDPWEMVLHVAANAAANNQDSTFLSRVIPAKEINGNARPGIEIYFKEDVGPAALNSIMDFLKAKEVDGFTLVVDPRAEERVARPVQMRGIRFQYIPEFSKDGDKWAEKAAEKEQILREAIDGIMSQEGVAFVKLVQYDTLVLTREEDYGNQIDERELSRENVGGSRARVWIERARDAQHSRATEGGEGGAAVGAPAIPGGSAEPTSSEAAARAPPLEEAPTEEFERKAQASIDPANDGGIDRQSVAAMQYENQQEPARDPHGGRASLVRAMVNALTGASRDREGIEVPKSEPEVRGVAGFGSSEDQGRKGSAPLWRNLGATFRKREASLYSQVDSAAKLIQAANPEDPENPKDPARYQNSQTLLDLLSGKEPVVAGREEPIPFEGEFLSQPQDFPLSKIYATETPGRVGVERFKEAMREGAKFPPLIIRKEGKTYFLENGTHRLQAAWELGIETLPVQFIAEEPQEAMATAMEATPETPPFPVTDPELQHIITELRKEIPVIPQAQFKGLNHLDSGAEADVYHDPNSGIVYKFYPIKNGALEGSYVPGQIRLDRGGGIRIGMGERPTVTDVLSRMERANSHGTITPHELTAITPEGQLVFASPFVEGREVTQKNMPAALARAGIHFLSDLGATSGIAKLPDGRWVVYDDLHPGNVRTMPGGRVEVIDANNRELDSYEVNDLAELGKIPPEKPLGTPKERKRKMVQKYDNAIVVAPMVETYHGTPHEWAAEKKVRFFDGTTQWVAFDEDVPPDAVVIERAPAGRVRAEKVGAGEGHAAFGWGVLYSAQAREVAEGYRKRLSSEEGEWLIDGEPVGDASPKIINHDDWESLRQALKMVDGPDEIENTIDEFRREVEYREQRAAPRAAYPQAHLSTAASYRRMADVLERFKDRLELRKGTGNVYTVQLDVDDPELLDWFKPMKEQMWIFDKVATHYGVTQESAIVAYEENERLAELANNLEAYARRLETEPNATPELRKEIAREHADAEKRWEAHHKQSATQLGNRLRQINSKTMDFTGQKFYESLYNVGAGRTKRDASEFLNSVGVPGIVFLDKFSRRETTSVWQELRGPVRGWKVTEADPTSPSGSKTTSFDSEAEARAYVESIPRTNNYVMFDPEKIKVVAKNGEVVRTVADDMPAPVEPKYEPVSVAAMAEENVKDDRDLTVNPMAGTGRRTRKDVSVENYKPAGWTAPFRRLSWEIGKFVQQKRQMEAATIYRIQTIVKDFESKVKKVYKGKPTPEENRNIMLGLGNLDNRLTQEQAQEARKMTGAEREGFLHTAHMENVARFKQQQEEALNRLPDEVREAVNVLREELDLEAKETLKDTGLDTELRARLDANQGVFLHSNAFQHFDDDVWGNDIRKSDDPEAKRIRGAAENLFRNEIIAENAAAYQDEHKDVSDEDALRIAAASGDLDQQIATRLDDYLKKEADEPSRLHMLMGKMPVTRTEAGKMVSLDRENIPKEIRDLWGQYDDPATNFAKTLSVLANHNAQTRMQNAMLNDGLEKGYFWKQGESPGPRPPGLVQMSSETRGAMVGVWGPPELKEGLSLMNQRPVRSLFAELNSVPLMMKTVGSIGSAVRNFFGNPLFMVSNGNLPISVVYWPKAFWLSLTRAADSLAKPEGRKQLARMIELGVLDENVDSGILERIAKNARMGGKYEALAGFGPAIAAVQRSFVGKAATTVGRGVVTTSQRIYTMADNFWRLANYNVELLRQQKWINPDLSLEQQEEAAAEITRRTLPTYSNIPEWFRESYGKWSDIAAPYLSFQAEAMRTYASTWHLAGKELASGKPKEMLSGLWRLGGLGLATTAPIALGLASKTMFDYDDDDERAIRNGLPEYQRNNMLFFLPRDENGAPRYLDLNFMNPYSLVHKAVTAAWRGKEVGGAEAAAWSLAEPFLSPMPVPQFIADIGSNRDLKRGGAPIWDEYASPVERAASVLKRAGREFVPGTFDSARKIGEAYTGKVSEKTGEKRDLREEVMKVFPGTAITTFDRDKAMQAHVGEYKKAARNASGLFDKKMSADGPIGDGEVAATYKEADERSYRAFQEMHKAYLGLLKLKMKPEDAIKLMRAGFGSDYRKGGLSETALAQILSGNYQQFMPSRALLEETAVLHPERVVEFGDAQRQQSRSRTASP